MKKKGFTLIELLAVIVILAIIALIATPLVLKYIETARTNSKITSTQNYMKAVENALASYSITNKGKSYPEGCYEISTLNTDLDISMKGNMPSEGKVCIEDNKIKKSMVKYPDNKVIKYEDDKSTVSDEETYESFNSVSNYIIDEDLEFAYDESMSAYTATLTITKDIAEQFKEEMDYDFIIDDGKVELMGLGERDSSSMNFYTHTSELTNMKGAAIAENEIIVLSSQELTGLHNIKIGNPRPIEEKMFFLIEDDGRIAITGCDLVRGAANLLIKDNEGTEYFNNNIELTDNGGDGIMGADWGCRNNISKLPSVYTALANGKEITIQVTQVVEGKEKVSTMTKTISEIFNFGSTYFSRFHILIVDSGAC